jgi:hypothetical protein
MPAEPSDIMLIVKREKLPRLLELVKENNIRNMQLLFDGALELMQKYLQAIKEGKRFMEVDEKSGQVREIILDWRTPRGPTLTIPCNRPTFTILKGGKKL